MAVNNGRQCTLTRRQLCTAQQAWGIFSDFGQLSVMTTKFFAAGVLLNENPMTCASDDLALRMPCFCVLQDEASIATMRCR